MDLENNELGITEYSNDLTFISLASSNPAINASYFASLLEALNPNLRGQCIWCPSELTSIKWAPDPPSFDDPSVYNPHLVTQGVEGFEPSLGRSSGL